MLKVHKLLNCFDAVASVIWPAKIVPEMTYKVSSGTLSLHSLTHSLTFQLEQKVDPWILIYSLQHSMDQLFVYEGLNGRELYRAVGQTTTTQHYYNNTVNVY